MAVRIVGGPLNGLQGQMAKVCDTVGSLFVNFDGRQHEMLVELRFVLPLAAWRASRTAVELQLKGNAP
jgi:hypothetical protein